ncbi:peptide/nickel transport system ATP-binding protein [Lipingzhangella halophila]|uniref:Peptide/nickel transport system ATP-binding protein n=1 Tax=Lipingzhangella halophila TaxID=1783352 RepID=A0A7W7RI97_9ACTN|nr:ABC transporter ATP-binding protein [Lipingzhangella halophila]MBB4932063.1 peptide/nickel transport system ATP-binding protein [Lipingzhangella halophila]
MSTSESPQRTTDPSEPVVRVNDLAVTFPTMDGDVRAVDRLSFEVAPGGALGIVGESGSGKSATSLALMGLHRGTRARITGDITVAGTEVVRTEPDDTHPREPRVTHASDAKVRAMRGNDIAMVFQDPMSSLHPQYTIGDQLIEAYRTHRPEAGSAAARRRAAEALDRVGIPEPAKRVRSYPHEFSGGMRQRALIAVGLMCEPKVLLADEPTTALDVTVQAQILDLLDDLRHEMGMALILVSHDLAVVAGSVDEVLVMRDGVAVEHREVRQVLSRPEHPYTRSLLDAVPRVDVSNAERRARVRAERREHASGSGTEEAVREALKAADTPRFGALRRRPRERVGQDGAPAARPAEGPGHEAHESAETPLVRVEDVRMRFRVRGGTFGGGSDFYAVDGVSFELHKGETLGVVGESGSGKSTLVRMITRLLQPTEGRVVFQGHDITRLPERRLRPLRRDMQMIFQNPYSSLNPRMTIGDSIGTALRVQGVRDTALIRTRVQELLERVGLEPRHYNRFPHAFSGGQRQRIAIARALILRPKLVVCDEPVSALDVSTQEQMLRLLSELQDDLELTYIFVAHDLAVVRQVSDRVAVMRKGRIVEMSRGDDVYEDPSHPYTRQLLAAAPVLDPDEAREHRAQRAELRRQTGSGQPAPSS